MSSHDADSNEATISPKSHVRWQTPLIVIVVCALVAAAIVFSRRHDSPKSAHVSVTHYAGQTAPDFSCRLRSASPSGSQACAAKPCC